MNQATKFGEPPFIPPAAVLGWADRAARCPAAMAAAVHAPAAVLRPAADALCDPYAIIRRIAKCRQR
jgi:hypothetical protein